MGLRLTTILTVAALVLNACGDEGAAVDTAAPATLETTSDVTATTGPGDPLGETSTTTAPPASTSTPTTQSPQTTTSAAETTPTGRSLDLSDCAVEPRAEFRAPRMQFDGEIARIYVRDGGLHLTTEAISARLELPSDWIHGDLETTADVDGDGTHELLFTSFGNNVLVVAVMAIDGCDLVEVPVADDTTIEPQLLHGAGGNSCIGCVETLYCTPMADGRVAINHVSSIPTNRLLDDDYTLDDYGDWLSGPRSRQYVVRHYSYRDGALRLDYEEWDWLLEGQSPWPNSNRVGPCAADGVDDTPLALDETGLPGLVAFGASPAMALESLAMRLGPPTHDTGWSDPTVTFCDSGRLRVISWGDLRLVFTDTPFGDFASGLIQVLHTAQYTLEDGFGAEKPHVWPVLDTSLDADFGSTIAGARCAE